MILRKTSQVSPRESLAQRLAAVEANLSAASARIATLEAENRHLRQENAQFRQENETLKRQLAAALRTLPLPPSRPPAISSSRPSLREKTARSVNAAGNQATSNTCERRFRPRHARWSPTRSIAVPIVAARFDFSRIRPRCNSRWKSSLRRPSSPNIKGWPIGAITAKSSMSRRCRMPCGKRACSVRD